jgi:diguanylate cyclase
MASSEDLRFVRRIHRMRMLGLGLGFFCIASVFHERGASPVAWVLLIANGYLWPHLAYLLSMRSREPHNAETTNLCIDSIMGGVWIALIGFSLVPSAVIIVMLAVDKINVGGLRLLSRALPMQLVACAFMALAGGWQFHPESSLLVVISCLPFLLIYPMVMSMMSYSLARRVLRQNRMLEQMGRTDTLTGLPNRWYWSEVGVKELRRNHTLGRPASLLMIDIDNFKAINDQRGHSAGDEVLRRFAAMLEECLREDDMPARYAGDEFLVLLPDTDTSVAVEIAERIRLKAAELAQADSAEGAGTVSIGVATACAQLGNMHSWIEAADSALYAAKSGGRNRIAVWAIHTPHVATSLLTS